MRTWCTNAAPSPPSTADSNPSCPPFPDSSLFAGVWAPFVNLSVSRLEALFSQGWEAPPSCPFAGQFLFRHTARPGVVWDSVSEAWCLLRTEGNRDVTGQPHGDGALCLEDSSGCL